MDVSSWRNLERDEPVGVVALSGPVDPAALEQGLDVLRAWGNPVELASNLPDREGYLAGSDADRLAGLIGLLDNGVRTLIAARGGFGVTRLLDRLPWDHLVEVEARFVGFSDLTALLNPLARQVIQIHGPMAASGLQRGTNAERLHSLLRGDLVGRRLFKIPGRGVLRHGKTEGIVVGGNLSLLSSVIGTPWESDFSDGVLFLEEVSEPPYRIDRLLTHLRSSASFSQVKALICGSLHACRPHAECVSRWSELLLEAAPCNVPVITGMPFGHGSRNDAFPIGATVTVDTRRGEVVWST